MMKKTLLYLFFGLSTLHFYGQCYETLTFGGTHTVGMTEDGVLWGWGSAGYGQLASTNTSETLPIQIDNASDWNSVYSGVINTFAIKNDGTLWGVGDNQFGSLGVGSQTQNFFEFQQITTATNWIKVAPSRFFTVALRADGTLWAWGQNDMHQTGSVPAAAQQLLPAQIGTATDWVDIATGTNRTAFALKSDGTLWGWGANTSSIIVQGSATVTVNTPTQANAHTDWVKMSIGAQHILAQKTDGTLWSWGGGIGLGVGGTPTVTNTPQQISMDTWKAFSTGTNTSYAIKSDGTLWAWGINNYGQLGDGTEEDRLVPTQIGTDTDWETVQARNFLTIMATKTDGSVWYWGVNYNGEFGNGTSFDENLYMSPQQTPDICVAPSLSVPDAALGDLFTMYPNPAAETVTIAYVLPTATPTALSVYDLMGREVMTRTWSGDPMMMTLGISDLSEGLYLVVVRDTQGISQEKKLVVQRR